MVEIVPAIIAKTKEELFEKIKILDGKAGLFQLDIMDNKFVPNETWRHPEDLLHSGLTFKSELEAHLMIMNPQESIDAWLTGPVKRIIFHWESVDKDRRKEIFSALVKKIHEAGKEAGIAINPESNWEDLGNLIDGIDVLLFLSVHPGFYGKEFIPEVIPKIASLRKAHKNAIIEVDGGIKLSNVMEVIKAGANRVVVGSAVYKAADPAAELDKFRSASSF
jgi:ribulose-phosphate 3-epimerase